MDLNGNFTSLNKAGEGITGYTRGEALKMNIAEVVIPEHVERAREMIGLKARADVSTVYELDIVAKVRALRGRAGAGARPRRFPTPGISSTPRGGWPKRPQARSGPTSSTMLPTARPISKAPRPEIWEQMAGRIDGFTCTAGSGGTIAGVGLGWPPASDIGQWHQRMGQCLFADARIGRDARSCAGGCHAG